MAFSHDVKDELIRWENRTACCREAEALAALALAARLTPDGILMNTAYPSYAARWAEQIAVLSGADPVLRREGGHHQVALENPGACARIGELLDQHGFDPLTHAFSASSFSSPCCRRAALRGMFLAGGSIGDPGKGYHLEIISRYEAPIRLTARLLRAEGIRPHLAVRQAFHMVYLKDGGHLADFLRASGAHAALLSFETLRVEKDMRNAVNRVVNCDTANSTRVAHASARQLELLREMEKTGGLSVLPEDLREVARVRLTHPGLSIRELGEHMSPPIGKSGMSHRLRRLELIAREQTQPRGEDNAERKAGSSDNDATSEGTS